MRAHTTAAVVHSLRTLVFFISKQSARKTAIEMRGQELLHAPLVRRHYFFLTVDEASRLLTQTGGWYPPVSIYMINYPGGMTAYYRIAAVTLSSLFAAAWVDDRSKKQKKKGGSTIALGWALSYLVFPIFRQTSFLWVGITSSAVDASSTNSAVGGYFRIARNKKERTFLVLCCCTFVRMRGPFYSTTTTTTTTELL